MKHILDAEILPNAYEAMKKNPTDYMILRRIPYTKITTASSFPIQLAEPIGDEKSLAIIDIWTTGAHYPDDYIIEMAIVKVKYSPSFARVTSITDIFDELEDPRIPIREETTYLTGLTQVALEGRRFSEDHIAQILADRPLIVCHNAAQDRPFFDRRFPLFANLPWACSLREIRWRAIDHNIISLHIKAIAMVRGYFYESNHAKDECLALLWLLNSMPVALTKLLDNAKSEGGIIYACAAPYELKDVLKENSYRWDSNKRVWYKNLYTNNKLEVETDFLASLYDVKKQKIKVLKLDATNKYKYEY
jgi:DNA polymerase III subunit epsilon